MPGANQRTPLAKPNYAYEKRQRALNKQRKQAEKRQRRLAGQRGAAPKAAGAADDTGAGSAATAAGTGAPDPAEG